MEYLLILWIDFSSYRLEKQYTYFTIEECASMIKAMKENSNPYGNYACFPVDTIDESS